MPALTAAMPSWLGKPTCAAAEEKNNTFARLPNIFGHGAGNGKGAAEVQGHQTFPILLRGGGRRLEPDRPQRVYHSSDGLRFLGAAHHLCDGRKVGRVLQNRSAAPGFLPQHRQPVGVTAHGGHGLARLP